MEEKQASTTVVYGSRRSKPFKSGMPAISLAEAITEMNIVDPVTASYIEKGIIKLVQKLAVTGQELFIKDSGKTVLQIKVIDSAVHGPKLRAKFHSSIQKKVRSNIEPILRPSEPSE